MLTRCLIAYSIFTTFLSSAKIEEKPTELCPVEKNDLTLPECKNLYPSICSTGDFFGNKVTHVDEAFHENIQTILNYRQIARQKSQEMGNIVFKNLYQKRHTLFSDMNNDVFNHWVNYLKLLIDASAKAQSHHLQKGACGEATKASIVHSLIEQLKTGTRESIQLIELTGTPHLIFNNAVHVFAIYNSQPIKSQSLKDNDELQKLLINLTPKNSKDPVVTCDSWAEYHGEPSEWLEHIQQGKDHSYGEVTWQKIQITDYSIPSMRQGMNSKQRKFLTNLILEDILQPAVDVSYSASYAYS